MDRRHVSFDWKHYLACETAADPLSEKAHQAFVRSLYDRRLGLVIGALNSAMASVVIAVLSDSPLLYCLALLVSGIGMLRVVNASRLAKQRHEVDTAKLEFSYEFGAFGFGLALGTTAAAAIVLEIDTMAQVLIISNALGFGIGICAHNAVRPTIALGQLFLVCAPVLVATLVHGSIAGMFLAVTIVLLLPAMYSVVSSVFGAMRESFNAAERSAELAAEMEIIALTDGVTDLANRAGLDRVLPGIISRAAEFGHVGIFWIDLERFKEVNDLKGHQAGDKVLREIGDRIAALVHGDGIVARFAGDEFVVACQIADENAASALADTILKDVSRSVEVDGENLEITASIGIAVMPDDGVTPDDLMRHADMALFEAKAAGRSQIRFFTASMTRDLANRRKIETELRLALSRDELSVYFQPIVDIDTGRIRCFEALARWFHPEKGVIPPDQFIPVAEECGAIVMLGNWLTGQAARAATKWPENVSVAVNLSPTQIKAPGAAHGILSALRDAGLSPHRLELEITENLFLEDSPSIAQFIDELSRVGVRFALDDFGTGYSSLGYINQWPFSKIKVDRSFVSGAQKGRKSDAIIRAVSQMGETLGIEIVAEGLETTEQVKAVRAAGCTLGQGYYFSQAIPAYQASLMLIEEQDMLRYGPPRLRAG